MKAGPQGYLWSKYECFLMSGCRDVKFDKHKTLTQCDPDVDTDDRGDYNSSPCTLYRRAKDYWEPLKDIHKVNGGHFLNSTIAELKYETYCLAKTICQFRHVGFPTHFNTCWNT